jgi:opacity protein-like surface antigen
MKFVVLSSAVALVLAIPAVAAAQSAPASQPSSCPPGSWFCVPPADAQPVPAGKPVQGLQPLPDPEDETAPPPPPPRRAPRQPTVTYEPAPAPAPPVVVYQPPAPVMVERSEQPPPYEYAPPPRKPISPAKEWGLNLHLEGAAIGSGSKQNASMGGLGAGLRFKPTRYVGLETDLDFMGGHGYSGDQRDETALTFNALVFANPKDRAQVYFLAGFGWDWAHSTSDPSDTTQNSFDYHYTYFGGQIGLGLELRLTRVLAFNIDLRGFVRTRTDQLAQQQPEFTNPQTGQSTNTSGGALLTGGMTLYF